MAEGSIKVNYGLIDMLNAEYLGVTNVPTKLRFSQTTNDPTVGTTEVADPIPINDGTVCFLADSNMTGESGGDASTDNTTIYKDGGGTTDVTAQNLITNTSSATKKWYFTLDVNAVTTKPLAGWLYIADQTTLDYFLSAGTCSKIGVGNDKDNFYSVDVAKSSLSIGFNWITSGTTLVSALTQTGTPTGTLDTGVIIIITNNATDSWGSGDVVFDQLRQWDLVTDTFRNFSSGYPSVNEVSLLAEERGVLGTTEANGFNITTVGTHDTVGRLKTLIKHRADEKTSSEIVNYIITTRLRNKS